MGFASVENVLSSQQYTLLLSMLKVINITSNTLMVQIFVHFRQNISPQFC